MKFHTALTILGLLFSFLAYSEESEVIKEANNNYRISADKVSGKPKVFIEGDVKDENFMKNSIKFVDFVNDPAAADVHIIITRRKTGGGGYIYSVMYNNVTFQNISDYTISCTTQAGATDNEERQTLVKTIKMGLMPFANQSEVANKFNIKYRGSKNTSSPEVIDDPWNSWTVKGDLAGRIDWEETRKVTNSNYFIGIDRVTSDWRIRNSGRVSAKYSDITKDNGVHRKDTVSSYFVSSSVVNSLSDRWSVGAFMSVFNSTFRNTKLSYTFKPAIEYNIFPWDESDRKVFTLAYYIGPEWLAWYDETIYEKMEEVHLEEALRLDLRLVKTWGDLDAGLSATNFLDDFKKYDVSFDTGASVRLVRGLSVRFSFKMASIHNQIYIKKESISEEERLLGTIKLPTNFDLSANIGVRIQFGSVYNNVVNQRL